MINPAHVVDVVARLVIYAEDLREIAQPGTALCGAQQRVHLYVIHRRETLLKDGPNIDQRIDIFTLSGIASHWRVHMPIEEIAKLVNRAATVPSVRPIGKGVDAPAPVSFGNVTRLHGLRIGQSQHGCRMKALVDDLSSGKILVNWFPHDHRWFGLVWLTFRSLNSFR